ncbi:DUF1917 domain containing protein [Asbolus verrucosus]|uniref:DUF1917 domain containing protein n=1 Tax=Asbolus verrucosus TaxID=1661398 RepID=A0A482VC81_ASBVE|nr:DUF1917 domain containing protein [Asbolus verrucosus]
MNSKYDDMLVPPSKVGKWMLFLSQAEVNQVWKKIKEAIMEGHLWNSKVSTTDPTNLTYAIMIYTKDYNDVDDVINTLEYLERTGIKPANKIIKYKTDEQTRAGIYSGGKQRASIYDSATIKQKRRSQNDELSWRRRDGVSNLAPTTSNWRTSYNSRRN